MKAFTKQSKGINTMVSLLGMMLIAISCGAPKAETTASPDSITAIEPQDTAVSMTVGDDVGCHTADQCTPQTCRDRHRQMKSICGQKSSCKKISNPKELQRRLQINTDCLSGRLLVAECFSKPHAGHEEQIQNVERARELCIKKLGSR